MVRFFELILGSILIQNKIVISSTIFCPRKPIERQTVEIKHDMNTVRNKLVSFCVRGGSGVDEWGGGGVGYFPL